MTSRLMKWASIATLLGGLLAHSSIGYRIVLEVVVFVSALVVLLQAAKAKRYFWGTGFLSIAVLFNPIVPVALSNWMSFVLNLVCIGIFAISLQALKTNPTLSIVGIIRPPRLPEAL